MSRLSLLCFKLVNASMHLGLEGTVLPGWLCSSIFPTPFEVQDTALTLSMLELSPVYACLGLSTSSSSSAS